MEIDPELFFFVLIGFAVWLSVLPTFIAFWRRHPNRWLIMIINIAFGATVIGWLGALVWALHAVHKPDDPSRSAGGESGLNVFVNDVQRVQLIDDSAGMRRSVIDGKVGFDTAVAELERLAKLREARHLTEAEHEALKSTVLRRV